MAAIARYLVPVFLLCLPIGTRADDAQARVDYLIHCQGCHLPEGMGVSGHVPRMKNFLGFYLHSEEGRQFILQVPGAATANLSDARLANLINWILTRYSSNELPKDFRPYSEAEVSQLRSNLEPNPDETRKKILTKIAVDIPILADEIRGTSGY